MFIVIKTAHLFSTGDGTDNEKLQPFFSFFFFNSLFYFFKRRERKKNQRENVDVDIVVTLFHAL